MEKFLKKFSSVPNGFIEDFFNISKESYGDNELSINFDKVVAWLNVIKYNLKRLLIKNFVEDFDYVIHKAKKYNNNRGSNYVDNILITPDCFKELCMLSQTSKAKEVRQYYISIEKIIRQYHKYIQEKLYRKINLLEINQKPKFNIDGGIIYFFKALNNIKIDDAEEDLYKIGKTSNKKKRFNTYNSSNANDIEPLFIIEVDDIDSVENCIKNLIKEYQYRKNKEIFRIDVNTLKFVFSKCNSLVKGFKNYIDKNHPKIVDKNLKKMRHSNHGLVLLFDKYKN